RDVDRRRALPERPADDRPRDRDRPLPHQGAVGERAHGRRRGRIDRARPGADEGAARGPAVGRAEPGPAAYGKGGTEPTVTDANVVLGHLPPSLIGGEMKLDVEAARNACKKVGDALKISIEEAADGIAKIVNENMFGALRLVSIEQGYDPRDFALVAFGGAGPLHANALG